MNTLLLLFITVLIALSVCLAIFWFVKGAPAYIPLQGERAIQFDAVAEKYSLYRPIHQFLWIWTYWFSRLIPAKLAASYSARLSRAGAPGGLTGTEFLSAVPLLATLTALIGMFLTYLLSHQYLTGFVLGFVTGAVLPFARLDAHIAHRKRVILTTLPYTIDLLALCMRAGQTFHSALSTVTGEMPVTHPLRFELEFVSTKVALGASIYDGLRSFSRRVDLIEIRQFVQSAIRSHQKGSSLAEVFSIQATIIRTRRSEAAEQAASRAAVAMLGPLMLIFLSVFVILLGPFGVKAFYGQLF
jgi:tight adherence protein C